jgi:hypothetical protein
LLESIASSRESLREKKIEIKKLSIQHLEEDK